MLQYDTFTAYSCKEAEEKSNVKIIRNITPSYLKLKPDDDFNLFVAQQVKKYKLKDNEGLIIVVSPGKVDKKLRPYKFINNVVNGKMSKKLYFEVRLKSSNKTIIKTRSKRLAIEFAKKLMPSIKSDLVCVRNYVIDEEHQLAFSLDYNPSKHCSLGKYIIIHG